MAKKRATKPAIVLGRQLRIVYSGVEDNSSQSWAEDDAWEVFLKACNKAAPGSTVKLLEGDKVLAELQARVQARSRVVPSLHDGASEVA